MNIGGGGRRSSARRQSRRLFTQPRPRGPDVEWFAIGLARQKRHYSLYVNVVDDGQYLAKAYADQLGSASIGFNRLDDV